MLGVGAGADGLKAMQLAGVAGLVAGALSMAAGEYISVSSQKDAEEADIEKVGEGQLPLLQHATLGPVQRQAKWYAFYCPCYD